MRRRAILLVCACAVLAGCAKPKPPAARKLPTELLLPPGATNVSGRMEGGAEALNFQAVVPYPASDYLAAIRTTLEPAGWKPLPADWLNPTLPSSHARGWTYFFDRTASPHAGVHQWLAEWQNAKGDIVFYALRYLSPTEDDLTQMAKPANDRLNGAAALIPAATANAMREKALAASKQPTPIARQTSPHP